MNRPQRRTGAAWPASAYVSVFALLLGICVLFYLVYRSLPQVRPLGYVVAVHEALDGRQLSVVSLSGRDFRGTVGANDFNGFLGGFVYVEDTRTVRSVEWKRNKVTFLHQGKESLEFETIEIWPNHEFRSVDR